MMKISISLLATLAILGGRPVCADQTDGKQAVRQPTGKSEAKVARKEPGKSERVIWTGSLIPQRIHKNGLITDGTAPLIVIDRTAIERSGSATVAGVIRHYR